MGWVILYICLFCIYLSVGYTSVLILEAEDDTIFTIIFITLSWPVIWTFIIVFCILFTFIGRKRD